MCLMIVTAVDRTPLRPFDTDKEVSTTWDHLLCVCIMLLRGLLLEHRLKKHAAF